MGNLKRMVIASTITACFFGGTTLVSCSSGDDSAAGPDATADDVKKIPPVIDAGDTDANACFPQLPAGWPVWTPPNPISTTACTTAQVQSFYDTCFATGATGTTCDTFYGAPANSPCVKCMLSQEADATYGPILTLTNGTGLANIAGCIALTDGDLSATGCGAQYAAAELCPDFSCADNCLIDSTSTETDTATYNAYLACAKTATTSICSTFTSPSCAKDPKYAHCMYASFEAYFLALGDFACTNGLPVTDAGVDAGADADLDADLDAGDDAADAADD